MVHSSFKKYFCCKSDPKVLKSLIVEDSDAINLSHVGFAAYDTLRQKYGRHHNKCWDVSSGEVVGKFHQTPLLSEPITDKNHSDWFPDKMCEIISRTQVWCDILSLVPPDGLFLTKFKYALQNIDLRARELDENGEKKKPVTVRILFGNLVGMPVNCDAVIKEMTEDLPDDNNVNVWVGAWRRGVSWNHSKIIAVDGQYLHTGGHNLMDKHYLSFNPVHDLSLEMDGEITQSAHLYANFHWDFIEERQSTCCGQVAEKIPDGMPVPWKNRIIVSEFPEGRAGEFPPSYTQDTQDLMPQFAKLKHAIPIIGVGRLGGITRVVNKLLHQDRPADDAFLAMFDSAKKSLKLVCQDFGPVCFPSTKIPLPGLIWPKIYLSALARAIKRNVTVQIILSNPGSIPADCGMTEACYGNGWTCVDVAAEIVKRISKQYKDVTDVDLRQMVSRNLHVCYIRRDKKTKYRDGKNIGLHSKHFIVDDTCFYIGSQNLYYCDLAEWGVIIDNEAKTQDLLHEYWNPMWAMSYSQADCDLSNVMDGLKIDRDCVKEKQLQRLKTKRFNHHSLRRGNMGNSQFFNVPKHNIRDSLENL